MRKKSEDKRTGKMFFISRRRLKFILDALPGNRLRKCAQLQRKINSLNLNVKKKSYIWFTFVLLKFLVLGLHVFSNEMRISSFICSYLLRCSFLSVWSWLYSTYSYSTSCTNGRQKHLVNNWLWVCFWTRIPSRIAGTVNHLKSMDN